ncbi:MAG: thiamine diphosphokinase [Lachnospiraceae bacterium]|nr:thiamine diphosphokinase [Lachnospiraceae bacterium]
MGRCIIVAAGDLTVGSVKVNDDDLVIAVDGGLGYCSVLELEPDLILGDFDSVSEQEKEAIELLKAQIPERIIQLPDVKDDTDTLAAIRIGLENGYDRFLIYAGTGGRLEHTFANIQCLLYLKNHNAVGYLMDGSGMICVLQNEEVKLKDNLEGYLSLFSLGKEARGVTIRGMKYELEDTTITNDFPVGISNEFIGQEALVKVEDGELLMIINYVSE